MGISFSSIWAKLFHEQDRRIVMIGLDGAGKTTILNKLALGEVVNTVPTIGFNVETVSYKSINFNVWDVGGQEKIRPLWRHYFQNTDCVIFVVDSQDTDRVDDSRLAQGSALEELQAVLANDELRDAALLVFANKQDLPGAMPVKEMTRRLGLHKLRGRDWFIQGCSAVRGEGLYEGLDWMSDVLRKRKPTA